MSDAIIVSVALDMVDGHGLVPENKGGTDRVKPYIGLFADVLDGDTHERTILELCDRSNHCMDSCLEVDVRLVSFIDSCSNTFILWLPQNSTLCPRALNALAMPNICIPWLTPSGEAKTTLAGLGRTAGNSFTRAHAYCPPIAASISTAAYMVLVIEVDRRYYHKLVSVLTNQATDNCRQLSLQGAHAVLAFFLARMRAAQQFAKQTRWGFAGMGIIDCKNLW